MATFRLRRFSRPEILRAMAPERLTAFLRPYAEFLSARGLAVPGNEAWEDRHHQALAGFFLSPDPAAPADLLDALYFIDEMATPEGMDALLEAAGAAGLDLRAGDGRLSPADVAVQVWLADRRLVERRHAEQALYRPRSFEYYRTDRRLLPGVAQPMTDLAELERALDDWFERRRRGAGTRVFVHSREDEVWFLVRHGEPFQRQENIDPAGAPSVCFRPVKYDLVVYRPDAGELRVNARSHLERELYRREFGRHLLGSTGTFPSAGKYTLDPLRAAGPSSLVCIDVPGIEQIRLRELHLLWPTNGEVEVRKAPDVFEAFKARGYELPERADIIQAAFQVKFADCRRPRTVVIRPPNVACYTRDGDSGRVEEWLRRQGFVREAAGTGGAGDAHEAA